MADQNEDNKLPQWYRVCLNTIVRKDVKLDSERLRILPMGSRVNVISRTGRRVQIDQPIKGWCSLSSSNGDTILKPLESQQPTQTPRTEKKEIQSQIDAIKTQNVDDEKTKAKLKKLEEQINLLEKEVQMKNQANESLKKQFNDVMEKKKGDEGSQQYGKYRNGDVIVLNTKQNDIVICRWYGERTKDMETMGAKEDGMWLGVEFEEPTPATYDPIVNGKRLFDCKTNCGYFVPEKEVKGGIVAEKLLKQLSAATLRISQMESALIPKNRNE